MLYTKTNKNINQQKEKLTFQQNVAATNSPTSSLNQQGALTKLIKKLKINTKKHIHSK